tara:strand:+ start:218 stop:430 length:213 start_codon:yes stop_codon:yes gene_type:complete
VDSGKLAGWRSKGVTVPEVIVVIRGFAVSAPMPEILPGVAVIDDDSTIPVAVRKIGFIGVRVDPNTGWAA